MLYKKNQQKNSFAMPFQILPLQRDNTLEKVNNPIVAIPLMYPTVMIYFLY